jgi:hypothetical protein
MVRTELSKSKLSDPLGFSNESYFCTGQKAGYFSISFALADKDMELI